MAGLVGHHVHVARGAVEVRQDEGLLVQIERSAVAASPFVLAGVHVESLRVHHHIDEAAGLLAHGVVHFLCGFENGFLAERLRIAAGDHDVVIIEHVIAFDTEALRVLQAELRNHGNDVL